MISDDAMQSMLAPQSVDIDEENKADMRSEVSDSRAAQIYGTIVYIGDVDGVHKYVDVGGKRVFVSPSANSRTAYNDYLRTLNKEKSAKTTLSTKTQEEMRGFMLAVMRVAIIAVSEKLIITKKHAKS